MHTCKAPKVHLLQAVEDQANENEKIGEVGVVRQEEQTPTKS